MSGLYAKGLGQDRLRILLLREELQKGQAKENPGCMRKFMRKPGLKEKNL
jgi:hypothetical protein